MKKWSKCSKCDREDIFEEDDEKKICTICKSSLIQEMLGNIRRGHLGKYEQFIHPGENNPFSDTPCPKRMPGGNYCYLIDGHLREISVIICLKCKDRITDNTLSDVIKEDDDAIE